MDASDFPVFALLAGLMVVLFVFAARMSRAQRKAMAGLLEPLGFIRVERSLLRQVTSPFRRLFNGGVSGAFSRPTKDGEEYLLEVVQQMGKHTHIYTVFARRQGAPLPLFRLRPEGVLDRVAAFSGFDDIDFDDAPEFSAALHLSGESPDAIRDLFTQDICLSLSSQKLLRVSAGHGWLVVHDWRHHPHTRIVDFLTWATGAADLFG